MKNKKKLKDIILILLLWLNIMSFLAFACMVDSNSCIPYIICATNLLYIFLFLCANDFIELRG